MAPEERKKGGNKMEERVGFFEFFSYFSFSLSYLFISPLSLHLSLLRPTALGRRQGVHARGRGPALGLALIDFFSRERVRVREERRGRWSRSLKKKSQTCTPLVAPARAEAAPATASPPPPRAPTPAAAAGEEAEAAEPAASGVGSSGSSLKASRGAPTACIE